MEISQELKKAFHEIHQSRTEFALRNFVVGEKDSEIQAWCQCVLEAEVKYRNLQHAAIDMEIHKIKIEELEKKGDRISILKAQKKRIDLESMANGILAQERELVILQKIFDEMDVYYTRKDIENDQETYWRKRLTRQAALDYMATNRIGVGNLDAIRMANMQIPKIIEMDTIKQLGYLGEAEDEIKRVENNYLAQGNQKILIAIPTEHKLEDEKLLQSLMPDLPTGKQVKLYNACGMSIPDAYTNIFDVALSDDADFVLTIEDDTFAPKDALIKLVNILNENKGIDAIGAWYPVRNDTGQSTAIGIDNNGIRVPIKPDQGLKEVYTLPFGFTLFRTSMFKVIQKPWFAMTDNLTQDSFLSQKARESGFKLFVDTDIRAKHIDRMTGKVYE